MSLFTRRHDPFAPPPTGAGYSVLDARLTVRGDIETDGTLRVDGRLEGSVLRADIVVLGEGGTIVGDVRAREVIVAGTVEGHITAVARTELQSSAVVTGDIEAGTIMIHEGGAVQGRLSVKPQAPDERTRKKAAAAADAAPSSPAASTATAAPATAAVGLTGTGA